MNKTPDAGDGIHTANKHGSITVCVYIIFWPLDVNNEHSVGFKGGNHYLKVSLGENSDC